MLTIIRRAVPFLLLFSLLAGPAGIPWRVVMFGDGWDEETGVKTSIVVEERTMPDGTVETRRTCWRGDEVSREYETEVSASGASEAITAPERAAEVPEIFPR